MSRRGRKPKIRKEDIEAAKLYRKTCLGKALEAALTTMNNENQISEDLYEDVLSDFDYEMITGFKYKVHTEIQPWVGTLCEYKQLDGVWNFHLKNVHLKTFPAPVSEDLFVKDLAITTFKLDTIPKPKPVSGVKVEKDLGKVGKRNIKKEGGKKKKDKKKSKRATPKKKVKKEKTSKKRGAGIKKERIPKKKKTASAKRRPKVNKKKKKKLNQKEKN